MITISEDLKSAVQRFHANRSGRYGHLMPEFKRFCQEHFRYSINTTCKNCIAKYTDITYNYLKENGEL